MMSPPDKAMQPIAPHNDDRKMLPPTDRVAVLLTGMVKCSRHIWELLRLARTSGIEGLPGWVVRNFYGKDDVMKQDFRERGIDQIKRAVSASAGWLLINSKDNAVATLLEIGRRMQRLFLSVRERKNAIHPITQSLEEASTKQTLHQSIGISETIQFILCTGYVKDDPLSVSLRRPVDWFLRQ